MIGVISKPSQLGLVEEFFELFKTPWELYRPGAVYDVVIATADQVPEVNAKLLVVYGTARKNIDARSGVVAREKHPRAILSNRDASLPIYSGLLTFANDGNGISLVTASPETAGFLAASLGSATVLRLGFDLFEEIRFLLATGQPVEYAHIPTLDIHIGMLREWILSAGVPLLEIPPAPAGYGFAVCLTHDIDFIGIRNHRFDHSMWGFAYRATAGAVRNFIRGRLSFTHLFRSWAAAASLPFVYAGWAKDFWEPFGWYAEAERGLPATYFLIPFKRRAGERVPGRHASRRATAYDVSDLPDKTALLLKQGCELGVHGLDAWHNADAGRGELTAIRTVSGENSIGVRMHWLLRDSRTPSILDQAGYSYDSTFGYNETVGYLAGTSQVFRPLGAQTLLELPLHIQDGALFYPGRLNLSEPQAEKRCQALIDNARKFGGVLTLLWHDRSHGPERFWGDFYLRLLKTLKSLDGWFGSAAQTVGWFQKRRQVRFERTAALGSGRFCYAGDEIQPPLTIRFYRPSVRRKGLEPNGAVNAEIVDFPWNGKSLDDLERRVACAVSGRAVAV